MKGVPCSSASELAARALALAAVIVVFPRAASFECNDFYNWGDAAGFMQGMCCTQGNAECITESGEETSFPLSCRDPACYRAVSDVVSSCIQWAETSHDPISQQFLTSLRKVNATCHNYKTNATLPHGSSPESVITLGAPDTKVPNTTICGAIVVNGPSKTTVGSSTATLSAPGKLAVRIDFEAMYVPAGNTVSFYDGDSASGDPLQQFEGRMKHADPKDASLPLTPQMQNITSTKSVMTVEYIATKENTIYPALFRAQVRCVCQKDSDCGKHGSCGDNGQCVCNPGYEGDTCDQNVCEEPDYCGANGRCYEGLCYCTGNYTLDFQGKCTVPPSCGPRGYSSACSCIDGYSGTQCMKAPTAFTVSGAFADGPNDEPNGDYQETGMLFDGKMSYKHKTNESVVVRWVKDGWEMDYVGPPWSAPEPEPEPEPELQWQFARDPEPEPEPEPVPVPPPDKSRKVEFFYNPYDTTTPPISGWQRDGQHPFTTDLPIIHYGSSSRA